MISTSDRFDKKAKSSINIIHAEGVSLVLNLTKERYGCAFYPNRQPNQSMIDYYLALTQPNYPMPTTIGFHQTCYGTYLFDTRYPVDGMPLFRGYVMYYTAAHLRGWSWVQS